MTPPTTWAAGAILTGLVAAGIPATAAAGTPQPPGADAVTQSADALSKCLTDHGYPPLPPGAVLTPAPAGTPGPAPTVNVPTVGTIALPVPGTATPAAGLSTPAAGVTTPTAGTTTPAAGATPLAGTTPGGGATTGTGSLQCGQFVINNYFVTVTTTTTTTNVDAPITAAAGSISTTTGSPAAPSHARPSPNSAVGRPLRAGGGTPARHKRARRVVRVRLSGTTRRLMRVRLIVLGRASRR